jgi:DNA-binding NtrC family response regulator
LVFLTAARKRGLTVTHPPKLNQQCILVVDRHGAESATLSIALIRADYRVAGPFAGCVEASEWLVTDSADGAFLDISLSDPTCFALTTELRKRGVPFIFHSGWGILERSSQDPNAGDFSPLTTLLNAMTKLIQKTPNGGADAN